VAILSSCQKEESVKAAKDNETAIAADSTQKLSTTSPRNYLASKGILKVKMQDSTYSFDATKDSIVFVNISLDGKEYYGITAINKEHTVSFAISSPGAPISEMAANVSGCQFLLHPSDKTDLEYTLTRNATSQDYGTMSIDKYNQDSVMAKGSFHTYLARDTKKDSPFYIVDGSFELKVK